MRKFDRYHQFTTFSIWQPRWHDRKVLLKADKVDKGTDYLKVVFDEDKSPTMKGNWVISRHNAKQFKKESNGTIQCYAIPLDELDILEFNKHSVHEL